jgi:hypothetical protein
MSRIGDQLTGIEHSFASCKNILKNKQRPACQNEDGGSYLENHNSDEDISKKSLDMRSNEIVTVENKRLGAKVAMGNKCALLIMCSSSCKVWQHTLSNIELCVSRIGGHRSG